MVNQSLRDQMDRLTAALKVAGIKKVDNERKAILADLQQR